MKFIRYSAIGIFGYPMDNPEVCNDTEKLVRTLSVYPGVTEHAIDRDPQDITPYYWQRPAFKYFLSLAHPEGPAVLDMLPVVEGSECSLILPELSSPDLLVGIPGFRRTEVGLNTNAAVVAGPGPRYSGQLCIHELIACVE